MRFFYIKTFGCQMNVYDSGRLAELLINDGWSETKAPDQADFIFLNTCSVRAKARERVIGHLNHLKSLKDKKPDLVIALGGCVAQADGRDLLDSVKHLDLVIGPQHMPELPSLLAGFQASKEPICRLGFGEKAAWAGPRLELGAERVALSSFLTIMQGCDNFCAYCIVPYVRGREISRESGEILKEARGLLAKGAREITLLGQNVNSYGHGLVSKISFPSLLKQVAALDNLWRLRFTTSHPKDLSPELIALFKELPVLCRQLHLPFQSGSTKVLKEMGRGYTQEGYLRLIEKLKEAAPDIALSADVIVGFPGETEADFEETLKVLETVEFDSLFSFQYSDRPGTKAAERPDKIEAEVKSRRLATLQTLQRAVSLKKNEALVGASLEVLVEGPFGREPGQLTGRTEGLKIVNFKGPEKLSGSLANVKIIKASANSLLGEL